MRFRAAVASGYLGKLRQAADSVRQGVRLVPITFPPPISLLTGVNFRSFAESLGAGLHLELRGENNHHIVEAGFKCLGRALRQAVRVEDDALPSTKGVL